MKHYKVSHPAIWFEIDAKNEKEAIKEFWWSFDQMQPDDEDLKVKEI